MYKIDYYQTRPELGKLINLPVKRDWMEETFDRHAYNCFPVTLTNGLGWGIAFPEDISFIWDGITDSTPDHVKVLSGEKYVFTGRANSTISFNSGIMFKTEENISMLSMPVPNLHIPGVSPFTTIISTSFFKGEIPIAWRITEPNVEITIKAGTPVIALMPISLTELNNSEMNEQPISNIPNNFWPSEEHTKVIREMNMKGIWSNFYRDAVDYLGNKVGKHEVKAIRLKINDRENK